MHKRDVLSYFFAAFASKTNSPFLNSTVTRLWSVAFSPCFLLAALAAT